MNRRLRDQLRELGIDPEAILDPHGAWLVLFEAIGKRATLIDRYEIEAAHQGVSPAELTADDRLRIRREVLPVLFPGWEEAALVTQPDAIIVVEYDPHWPQLFGQWQHRLTTALGELPNVIEHVGSTAVPDLAAKPVIDISVAVPDPSDEAAYVSAVESCGVMLRSRDEGHRYFRPGPPNPRTVQIHVVGIGSEWQQHHLLFRDYLRAHREVAAAYGELKKDLAVAYRDDRLAYNAAKTDFILDHMDIAESWASTSEHST